MHDVKIGDKVKVVDPYLPFLEQGKIYTVNDLKAMTGSEKLIKVEGIPRWFHMNRFTLFLIKVAIDNKVPIEQSEVPKVETSQKPLPIDLDFEDYPCWQPDFYKRLAKGNI